MNTLQLTTSIKKELWEYKKIFFWVPLIIAALIIVAPVFIHLINGSSSTGHWLPKWQQLAELQQIEFFSRLVYGFVSIMFIPFIAVATIIQFYYLLACLYDERKDLSVLFWRSLPVSDSMNIAVKLLTGSVIVPVVFMLAATATLLVFILLAFILCSVLSISYDISLWRLWGASDIVTNLLSVWINLLPYILWLFPLYAWLMLVSMFASKAPFLWATLPVVVICLIEVFISHYFNLDGTFISHALAEYFSITADTMNGYVQANQASPSFNLLPFSVISEKISLVGIALGMAFIYGTYWLRVNRSHS